MELQELRQEDLKMFKSDMQEAFQLGAEEGTYDLGPDEVILPEQDINNSLSADGSIAYKAVDDDGAIVGGAIVVIDKEKRYGHLDFLYVKHGVQSRGVGRFIWNEIERHHTEVDVWKTCTPYFEKRNIHFYVNVCGFHIVEFLNARHHNPDDPDEFRGMEDGMFVFEKRVVRI